jgi:hypothetical protein
MAKRKKPVKRRKVRSDCGISRSTWQVNEPAPPDPMLVAYIDEIHNAASVRDRAVYKAQQKFAWDLADAWKRWKKE